MRKSDIIALVMPDIFVPTKKEIKVNPLKSVSDNSSRHLHRFASFCTHPAGISFQNKEPDEKILLFLRKHFITNIYWILATILLAFIPPVLAIIFSRIDIFPF
ncbi:MAG: hypothetical protein U1E54_02150, partial [Candidatus Levybacteria bacterium]|nr:hypothetical protein [Candidatus Levybacteria bacterium]